MHQRQELPGKAKYRQAQNKIKKERRVIIRLRWRSRAGALHVYNLDLTRGKEGGRGGRGCFAATEGGFAAAAAGGGRAGVRERE